MLTGAVFLDVSKVFDTVWINGLLYKLTLLNTPSYIVHTNLSYFRDRTFEASFQTATRSRRRMRAGVNQGGLTSQSSSVCLSTTSPILAPRRVVRLHGQHSHHSHFQQEDATCQLPGVEPQRTQRWLSERRIAIKVSKSTAIIFARDRRQFICYRPVTLFGEPIEWVDTNCYLG
jgi:hypothetical protein